MHLSARLNTIASLIPEKKVVVDIGCDHALLDIYLTKNKKNKCIASDISEQVLAIAKKNIKNYQLEEKIQLIKSNGLEYINPPDDSVLVIAGMGTSTILNILENDKIKNFSYLIIQTNNDWCVLREKLSKKNFHITEEKIVCDKGKYYVIMKWAKGKEIYSKKQCFLGPLLMKNKENYSYYSYLFYQYCSIYKKIPRKYFRKKYTIFRCIKWIQKELKNRL